MIMEKKKLRKRFDFYGYNSPTSGLFRVNGCEYFYGEDYRTEKRYREYKNVGFNILLLQHENSYSGEEYSSSAQNKCMTEAVKAGIKKIIISDTRLKKLCVTENLTGENGLFKTEGELDDYVCDCVKPYCKQKGFYGIQLFDEPEGKHLASYGAVYASLKRILPEAYIQCNLLNIVESERTVCRKTDKFTAYEEYLNKFLDCTGADYLLFDEYPFRKDYIIGGFSIRAYQIVTKVCKERGVEFKNVLQTWSWINTTASGIVQNNPRRIFESDLYWQLNMLMGFGCKEYAFFTYFTKQEVVLGSDTRFVLDGSCMINRDGTKTKLYYHVKKIVSEMKKFQNVIIDYAFSDSYFFFEKNKTAKDFMQTEFCIINPNCPIETEVERGVALVTELVKGEKSIYMVQNINNLKDDPANVSGVQYKINLKGRKAKNVYYRGEKIEPEKEGCSIKVKLLCGDAVFIETENN